MSHRTRAFSTSLAAAVILAVTAVPGAAAGTRWEVTFAIRLADGTGDPISLRLALPPDTAEQQLQSVDVSGRGFDAKIVREGSHPYVVFSGRLREARRIAVTIHVDVQPRSVTVPPIGPLDQPRTELLPYVRPAPLFQSRSLLVREFLETNVAPLLNQGTLDPLHAILTVTRERLRRSSTGKSLALDVIRRGEGKRIGIERAFTTFLRCARIPARFVEGVRLSSSTRRKRMFWTEVWSQDRWWPMSASSGWIGKQPPSALALATDGTRVVTLDGKATVSYAVRARSITTGANEP